MPNPSRLHLTLVQATLAFQSTPGRAGRLIALQDVDDVLVAGDLHGNVENLRVILKRADLEANPRRHLVLQEAIHGPFLYPDGGGEKSHQMLDLVAALKCQYPDRFHFLLGNHEMAQMTEQRIAKGGKDLLRAFRAGVDTAYGEHAQAIYDMYLEMLRAAPLVIRTPNRILMTHSLPDRTALKRFDISQLGRDDLPAEEFRPGGMVFGMLWGRDVASSTVGEFLARAGAELLITGHIPCDLGYLVPNELQLILDCQSSPASLCLFPADRPLRHHELISCVWSF